MQPQPDLLQGLIQQRGFGCPCQLAKLRCQLPTRTGSAQDVLLALQQQPVETPDDPDITQLLANYLQAQGFRVSPLRDGAALMALMATDTPQLVLPDLG